MRLRAATVADADALVALEAELGPDGWDGALVRQELTAPWRYVVVAEDAGSLTGWASLLESDGCDVIRMAVAPAARRRGTGRALLDALLERAGERAVLLEVEADNIAAQRLYAAAGFVPIDRRADYYGPGRHALVLQRSPAVSG